MLNFPGSSSKHMLHCIDIYLEDKSIETVPLHVGANNPLNNNSQSNGSLGVYYKGKPTHAKKRS